MKSKDFFRELDDYAAQLRRTIEAEVEGFSTAPEDIKARREKVLDPVDGYEYFTKNYFPHYISSGSQSDLHRFLFAELPDIAANPLSQSLVVAAPRGESKTTLVTQMYTLWRIVTARTHFTVIVMDSIDQAYPMLETVKAELEFNPRIAADFPEAAGAGKVWQAGTAVTANGVKVQVAGSGKKLRGMRHGPYRPDLCILDDIENDEQVENPAQRDKLQRWIEKTIEPLGGPAKSLTLCISAPCCITTACSRARWPISFGAAKNLKRWCAGPTISICGRRGRPSTETRASRPPMHFMRPTPRPCSKARLPRGRRAA